MTNDYQFKDLPTQVCCLLPAGRYGVQREVHNTLGHQGGLPDGPSCVGGARHQRSTRFLSADPPGHQAGSL